MKPANLVLMVAALLALGGTVASALSFGEVTEASGPMTIVSWVLIPLGLAAFAIGLALKVREQRGAA